MRNLVPWFLLLPLAACTGSTKDETDEPEVSDPPATEDSDEDTGAPGAVAAVQFAAIFGYDATDGKLRTVTTSQGALQPQMQFIAVSNLGVSGMDPNEICGVGWAVNNGASAPAWIADVDGYAGIGRTLPEVPAAQDQCKGWYAWPEGYKIPSKVFEGSDLGFAITELDPDVKSAFGDQARDALGVVLRSSLIPEDQILGLAFAYPVDDDWNQTSEDYLDAEDAIVDGKAVTALYQLSIGLDPQIFATLFAE